MNDENLIHVAPETVQQTNINDKPEHALVGKIARLPHDLRDQLNQRLLDGKSGPEILAWLNELPAVKEILRIHFDSAPITPQNLSKWRANGYQCWLKKQEPLAAIRELSEDATDIFRAGRGRIASGAATIASGQILEFLRSIPAEKRNTADLAKIVAAVTTLIKAEQNDARLILAEKRVRQRDE